MNKKRKLMKLPHPGKFIHELLREPGLNVELAAEVLEGQDSLNQSQKMTAAAMHMLEKKVWAQRSYRV